jgi:hypothetical protein
MILSATNPFGNNAALGLIRLSFHQTASSLPRGSTADYLFRKNRGRKRQGYTEIPCFLAAFFNCSSAWPKLPPLTNRSNSS